MTFDLPPENIDTQPAKSVTTALHSRITARAFLDKPVPEALLLELLDKARRSPSGGNLQPWFTHVLTGEALSRFCARGLELGKNGLTDTPTHPAYPEPLWEPKKTWRRDVGYQLYELMGVERHDKAGRFAVAMRNMSFFGAPVGLIITCDTRCSAAQHMDVGIYLQSLMLLAREAGLHTAPQGWWRNMPTLCAEQLNMGEHDDVIVGLALGYADPKAEVNKLRASRAPLHELTKFYKD